MVYVITKIELSLNVKNNLHSKISISNWFWHLLSFITIHTSLFTLIIIYIPSCHYHHSHFIMLHYHHSNFIMSLLRFTHYQLILSPFTICHIVIITIHISSYAIITSHTISLDIHISSIQIDIITIHISIYIITIHTASIDIITIHTLQIDITVNDGVINTSSYVIITIQTSSCHYHHSDFIICHYHYSDFIICHDI
jgi:hypothetical protein